MITKIQTIQFSFNRGLTRMFCYVWGCGLSLQSSASERILSLLRTPLLNMLRCPIYCVRNWHARILAGYFSGAEIWTVQILWDEDPGDMCTMWFLLELPLEARSSSNHFKISACGLTSRIIFSIILQSLTCLMGTSTSFFLSILSSFYSGLEL